VDSWSRSSRGPRRKDVIVIVDVVVVVIGDVDE